MGTIAQEITRIQGAKSDLKASIINKGVQVPSNALIDDYASYVDQIQQGGGGNIFDEVDFNYLFYKKRFLSKLDDVYNSSRGNMTIWQFTYLCSQCGTLSSEEMQKIFNIVEKFASCGNDSLGRTWYENAFESITIGDNLNNLTFKPSINKTGRAFVANLFNSFNGTANNAVDLTVDLENFNPNTIAISNMFNFTGSNINVHLLNIPVDRSYGGSFIFGNTYYTGSVVEATVRGTANSNIDIRNATKMSIANYVNFFNSFSATTATNIKVIIPTSIYNQLTEDQKAIITDKGYVLATS